MKIAYQRRGQGPSVLLIHGVGGSSASWSAIAATLTTRFDVITMDLRGHGRSDLITGPLDARELARDALQVLDECGVESCAVAGFSLGGTVATALALDAPARVAALALLGTPCGRSPEEQSKASQRIELCRTEGHGAIAELNRERWFTDEFRAAHPEVVERRVAQVKACDADSYFHAFTVFCSADFAARLHELAMPVLVIVGEHDVAATPRMAELMSKAIANMQAHVLARLRHSLLTEAEVEVTDLLDRFFQLEAPVRRSDNPDLPHNH